MKSPFRMSSLLVSLLLLICFASAAQATTTFRGFLKSEQEVPPRQSQATGINVQFVLGVQQNGTFRFLINVAALP